MIDNQVVFVYPMTYPQDVTRSGRELALLLLGSYRKIVDATVVALAANGFDDVRPVHAFALRAIASGATSASQLGRSLAVSKQAAAKTITTLVDRGYVARDEDPADRRRMRIEVTPLGFRLLRTGERTMDQLRESWRQDLGALELETLEGQLRAFVGTTPVRTEAPGWVALELDGH